MTCVTLYFLLLFILFPSVSLSSLIKFLFFCSLLSPCFFTSNSLCNKKVIFLASAKNICFLCWASWKINLFFLCKMISHFVYLSSFFCFIFWTLFLFFTLFFWSIKKTLFLLENGAKTVSCFLFLFSWFQKHVVSEKIRVIFPLFLICFLNSSLSSLKTTKNSAKKSSCFVSVPSLFLFHLFSFNIFPYFLSSLFSLFTFSFHPFVHPFLLFSPFSFLSLFLHLMFPCSFFSPSPFLCIFFLFDLTFLLSLLFLISFFFSHFFFTMFFFISVSVFDPKISKISVVNFSWWNSVFVFWTLPSSVFHLLFFHLCVVLIPCLFNVLLIMSASWHYYSGFSSINFLFGPLKKKCRFVFGQRFQKISLILFLSFFKLLFFLSFINFCFWICSFMHDIQKHFAIFFVFNLFFGKYLVSFVVVPLFLSKKKKSPRKKKTWLSLYFVLSLICVISSCSLSLLLVFSFSTLFLFFLFLLSLSMCSSPYVCLSLCLFTLSLMLLLFIPSKKTPLLIFCSKKNLFICSSLLAKLFLFYLLCCFAPFSHLFFQSCSFEQEKLTPFFFWQKNNLFKTSKNFFSEILSFDVFNQKNLSSFFKFFFEISFLKNLFFWISYKKSHKMAFATNNVCPDLIFW